MATNPQHTGTGDNNGVEARIARLESDVSHLRTDVSDIKVDLRDLRKEMHEEFKSFRNEFDGKLDIFRGEVTGQFRLLWCGLFFITLGLAGMMAQGFGWL